MRVGKLNWHPIRVPMPLLRIISRRHGLSQLRHPNSLFDAEWYSGRYSDVREDGWDPHTHYFDIGVAEGRDPHPLFDTNWYLEENPDVRASGVNPLLHFMRHGAAEGRSPHPLFDTQWYLEKNPDVRASGVNPLLHFMRQGAAEGRSHHALFDIRRYLNKNPNLRTSGKNPLLYFLNHGAAEQLNPHPLFDTKWYLEENPDVRASGVNPLLHFMRQGAAEGRSPHPLFDITCYRDENPAEVASGLNPLVHYLRYGASEGRDPHPIFDTNWYLKQNPDVRAAGINPLVHFVLHGKEEGRQPNPHLNGILAYNSSAYAVKRRPVLPCAEEWETLFAEWTPPSAAPIVEVIIPVYKDYVATMRCLYSVLSARQETPYRPVVIDDCSPEPNISEGLERLAERGLVDLHKNTENLGYVRTSNLGMARNPNCDIVLMNADTEVFGNWLDRLRAAALRTSRTGTVTPLTNNGTICSYPCFIKDNAYRLEIDDAEIDRLAAEVNTEQDIEIPTGVGFCMYVRRACLDEVGLFNEESFGKGYGEENDLCRRAVSKGWRNIVALDVFVSHYGAASFGASKVERTAKAVRAVERLNPGYLMLVQEFIREDPIRRFREALDWARVRAKSGGRGCYGALLMVTHERGGGTERHIQELGQILIVAGVPVFVCRRDLVDDNRIRIEGLSRIHAPNLISFDTARDLGIFTAYLRRVNIVHVHIQHLLDFPERMSDFIRCACAAAQIAYDVTLHDYAAICPRINLVDGSGVYCGEPELPACETCIARNGSDFGYPSVWEWRERYSRLIRGARRVFVPHEDVASRIHRYFPERDFIVRQHPCSIRHSPGVAAAFPRKPGVRRIAIVGAINANKGSRILLETARVALAHSLPLEFILVGYSDRSAELLEVGNIKLLGRFEEGEGAERLSGTGADAAWFPSVWPETFCFALNTAYEAHIFPVVFDLGAPAARIRKTGWGAVMPLASMLDPEAAAEYLAEMPIDPHPANVDCLIKSVTYSDPLTSYYDLTPNNAQVER